MVRSLTLAALAFLAACSSSTETGPIDTCAGASLSGASAFPPLSGLVYQHTITLGTGQSEGGGPWIVILWQGDGGMAGASTSFDSTCAAIFDAGFPSAFFVAPQTLTFEVTDPLTTGPEQTLLAITSDAGLSEDNFAGLTVNGVGPSCVSGTFQADVTPSNPSDGTPLDGGATTSLSGTFSLPLCQR